MTLSSQRDLAVVRAGLERWLGRPVGEITRPAPGWSCETLIVEGSLVVRMAPESEGIFPLYDLALQAAAQQAAAGAGVAVAAPVSYEGDPSYTGAPFMAMPFVTGPIPAEFTAADPWLKSLPDDWARLTVWDSLIEAVARIHAVPLGGLDLRTGLTAELDFWAGYLDWATDGAPPADLVRALDWCQANRPEREPVAGLLWGDVRFGNVVFDPGSLAPRAVLDWDMVSAGPIEMDLAWFLALEQLQRDLSGMGVPGFGGRDRAVALVERRLGRPLADLEWYEIFALVRAAAVSTRIAILFERSGAESMFKPGRDPAGAAATARIAAL